MQKIALIFTLDPLSHRSGAQARLGCGTAGVVAVAVSLHIRRSHVVREPNLLAAAAVLPVCLVQPAAAVGAGPWPLEAAAVLVLLRLRRVSSSVPGRRGHGVAGGLQDAPKIKVFRDSTFML